MNNYFKVPDFVQLQRESFLSFLQNGVKDEIRHISPIKCETAHELVEIHLYADELEWRKPKFLPEEAKLKGQTYSIGIYVPKRKLESEGGRASHPVLIKFYDNTMILDMI